MAKSADARHCVGRLRLPDSMIFACIIGKFLLIYLRKIKIKLDASEVEGMKRIHLPIMLILSGMSLWLFTGKYAVAEEFSIRGGNMLRWARGESSVQGVGDKTQEEWFENVTNLSLAYRDLQLGVRQSLFRPSEFGEEQGGIDAIDFKYLEYRYSNLTLTAGNFYASIGRGLALNLYEDYTLNFDSNLEGAKAEYSDDRIGALAFRGRSYPSTSPEGSRVRENDVEGVMLKINPLRNSSLAGYYLYIPAESYPETRMPGGFAQFNVAGVGLYAESVLQYVQDGSEDPYYGNYLALDYTFSGLGIIADYKDYNFKKYGTYSAGGVTSSEPLAYQNPPLVQREFTTNLLAKHPHVPVYNDEVGFQLEVNGQVSEPLALTLNFSRSSLHRGGSIIPSLHEEDAPFWQLFLEGEYDFPAGHFLRLDVGVNEEVLVTGPKDDRITFFWQRKQAAALEGTYYLQEQYGLTGHFEMMRLEDVVLDDEYFEFYSALTLSRAPWGSATVSVETTGDPQQTDEDVWVGGEMDLNFLKHHNLLLFVGQDRGGMKCTSGRCRYVDPFEGVKLTWRTTF
jgi:hypothetical protein